MPTKFLLSGSALKVIALATMTIDHIALLFCNGPLQDTLRLVGRFAFPIFAFLLVEGYRHTGNFTGYLCSMLLFAAISTLPFNLMTTGSMTDFKSLNVLFSLSIGLALLKALDLPKDRLAEKCFWTILLGCLSFFCDYGINGLGLILIFRYVWPQNKTAAIVTSVPALGTFWPNVLGMFPILFYNGKRGFLKKNALAKYLFYFYYPLHITILCIVKQTLSSASPA